MQVQAIASDPVVEPANVIASSTVINGSWTLSMTQQPEVITVFNAGVGTLQVSTRCRGAKKTNP